MATGADLVLILTHAADHYTVDLVADELARRGRRSLRVDTDRFPLAVRASARLGPGGPVHALEAERGGARADEVRAVWCRHLWAPDLSGAELDARFVEGCARESAAAFEGFLDGLAGARWINAPAADRSAASKPLQLRVARELGLAVPRTLVTNDPERARAFHDEVGGRLVAKLLTRLTTSMEKSSFSVPTSAVSADDLEHLDLLRYSPMVFQERLEKDVELRIACVGDELFVGAIDASGSAAGAVDWREALPGEAAWERGAVPDDVADRLRRLLARLGLVYGAVDLVRTPAGEHVFLEVNPNGEWGMLQRDLGLPVAGALARRLAGGDAR